MNTASVSMNDETFYGYMHPSYNSRFYLALAVSMLLFPLIAIGLLVGTIFLIVPIAALLFWVAMRIFFANMLGNAILVSPENYPRILAMTEDIKSRMGYDQPIYVFVYEQGTFNAYMRHVFFRRAIFLNSDLLQSGVSDREVRWLIGRFVGYMRARRQAGVLGWVIRAAQRLLVANVFILPYERAMVHTGDRLALAEIDGDVASATSAMQKMLVGRELGYSVNPEGLLAQHRQVQGSFFAFLAQLWKTHPHTTARYLDLVLFTRTFFPAQYRVFEASNPGLPSDLDRQARTPVAGASAPPRVQAPWAWTCALAMLLVMISMGALAAVVVNGIAEEPTYAGPVGAPADDSAVMAFDAPSSADDDAPAPSGVPPNTHLDANGVLRPDEGCEWVSDDPQDLRVACN